MLALIRGACAQQLLLHLVDGRLSLFEELDLLLELVFFFPEVLVLHLKKLTARFQCL